MIPTAPAAIVNAQRMLRGEQGWIIAAHLIRFELTTEPDQYRVSWTHRRVGYRWHSLVPRLTLTPAEFREWERWILKRYDLTGVPE